jgi:4-hydroxy-tetrahydrodipicolinate reductase
MDIVICGPGRLGRAIALAVEERGWTARLVGRPTGAGHDPEAFAGADVVVDASRGEAVAANVGAALDAGVRRFVIATTGWDAARDTVETLRAAHGSTAIVAPNLSLGAAVFARLVERAAADLARIDGFDPFIWEWHRRGKADRPSGTARDLARRIVRADPRQTDLEVVAVRAGASPGTHTVGFDAPGETVELRLTARDRTAYAAGAIAAIRWLAEPREPGMHPFDAVIDDLLAATPPPAPVTTTAATTTATAATAATVAA